MYCLVIFCNFIDMCLTDMISEDWTSLSVTNRNHPKPAVRGRGNLRPSGRRGCQGIELTIRFEYAHRKQIVGRSSDPRSGVVESMVVVQPSYHPACRWVTDSRSVFSSTHEIFSVSVSSEMRDTEVVLSKQTSLLNIDRD